MTEEIFDVVDDEDRVVGQAPRSEVHRRGLLHRAVHIFVFNSRGELLLQRRSATKDEFPLCYTSSASGHLGTGETYDECAPRELQEELGLTSPIEFLAKFPASRETANEHTVLYWTVTDDPPMPDPGEIDCIEFREPREIAAMVEREPERFAPPFRVLFRWYWRSERQ
jgi:16S rRNA (adenine1518-N6/adenine1519-N6)-dimethyltransferase